MTLALFDQWWSINRYTGETWHHKLFFSVWWDVFEPNIVHAVTTAENSTVQWQYNARKHSIHSILCSCPYSPCSVFSDDPWSLKRAFSCCIYHWTLIFTYFKPYNHLFVSSLTVPHEQIKVLWPKQRTTLVYVININTGKSGRYLLI